MCQNNYVLKKPDLKKKVFFEITVLIKLLGTEKSVFWGLKKTDWILTDLISIRVFHDLNFSTVGAA